MGEQVWLSVDANYAHDAGPAPAAHGKTTASGREMGVSGNYAFRLESV